MGQVLSDKWDQTIKPIEACWQTGVKPILSSSREDIREKKAATKIQG